MENQENAQNQNVTLVKIPNSVGALITGILSIALCWWWGIIGLILAIISLVLAGSANRHYNQNPAKYYNYGNVKAGKVCGIIGLVLSIIWLIVWAILIAVCGAAILMFMHHQNMVS